MKRINVIDRGLQFAKPLENRPATNFLVIHHTGSGADNDIDASAEQIHSWHLNNPGWAGIGYHYVVRKNGTVEQGRPHWTIGSHAYGKNSESIGIHLSGDFTTASPTEAQIENTALLIANICTDYGLPIDRQHVFGHREVGESSCPGDVLFGMLDTIVGKANFYRYGPPEAQDKAWQEDLGKIQKELTSRFESEEKVEMQRYNTVEELPEWAKPTIEKMIAKGMLNGNGDNLDLSLDMIRVFVSNDRAGLYE